MVKAFLLILSISCAICQSQLFQSDPIHYTLRITNVTTCSMSQPMGDVRNVSIQSYNFQQYVSMSVIVLTDNFYMDRVVIRLERCLNYACEYFQQWRFPDVCRIALMKNQMWTPIIQQIRPKITCPVLKKGIYRTANATVNINSIVRFYPEAAKYQWRVNFTIYNDRGFSIYCLHFKGYLIQFTKKRTLKQK